MVEFPETKVKVRKTYWGASPEEVANSEDSEKWSHSLTHEVEDNKFVMEYDGQILNSPCRLQYIFFRDDHGAQMLVRIDYVFLQPFMNLYQELEKLLSDIHGPRLKGEEYKKNLVWLTEDGLTSIVLGDTPLNQHRTTCIFVKYNHKSMGDLKIDYYKEAMEELR